MAKPTGAYGYDQSAGPVRGKGFSGHPYQRRLWQQAPGWLSDSGPFATYMANLKSILEESAQTNPEYLQRQQAEIERGRLHTANTLRSNASAYGGTSSPAYAATLAAAGGASNRARGMAVRDVELGRQGRMSNALQAANPILTFLASLTAKKGAPNITGGAPGGGTDWLGGSASAASSVAQLIAAIKAGQSAPASRSYGSPYQSPSYGGPTP